MKSDKKVTHFDLNKCMCSCFELFSPLFVRLCGSILATTPQVQWYQCFLVAAKFRFLGYTPNTVWPYGLLYTLFLRIERFQLVYHHTYCVYWICSGCCSIVLATQTKMEENSDSFMVDMKYDKLCKYDDNGIQTFFIVLLAPVTFI